MNPKLLTLCAAACACTTPAWAQGSVTLSGVVDLAARRVSHDGTGSLTALVSGSNASSRLVFSGKEDLGGGLSAGFHLEHGLLADTGLPASAKFFDRRSTVSLASQSLGELRLGRDFVPSYSNWSRYDPFGYVGVARSANLVSATPTGPIRAAFGSNANTTVRSDNGVQWLLPAGLGGLEGGAMFAPGEGGAVASGLARLTGLRVGYANQAFSVSAATTRSKNSQTTAGSFRDSAVGGSVELHSVRLSAAWREFRYDSAKQLLWMLGAVATFGLHEVKASWIRSEHQGQVGGASIAGTDATQIGLGYVYNLSKRSALYATVARISNDGAARYVISDGPSGISAGGRSRGYEAGVRHRF
ncbi:porin [Aquabacterium sp.]|uniref:porin n=1 Tax=Aquabacterium sp. TaxID=1872578 RepID=UPI002C1FF891|nr:porin [Aquabacterium sp.]HSW07003.1 porin [Aquabacterium sp.]